MIEEEGKCRAEAEARGLPGEKSGNRNGKREEASEEKMQEKDQEREKYTEAQVTQTIHTYKAYITLYTLTFSTLTCTPLTIIETCICFNEAPTQLASKTRLPLRPIIVITWKIVATFSCG